MPRKEESSVIRERRSKQNSPSVNDRPKRTPRNARVYSNKKEKQATGNNSKPTSSVKNGTSDESDLEMIIDAPKLSKGAKYFSEMCILSNARAKPLTSDNTLKNENLDFTTLHSLVKSTAESHLREREEMCRDYSANINKWVALIEEGFNIMFYGVGSKLAFVDDFVQKHFKTKNTLTVHGFFPGLSMKQMLNSITLDIMDHNGSFSNVHSQAEYISQNLYTDLYVIIHNMDGPVLSAERNLALLCQLSKCDKIHFIATVDHVNSGLIFNSSSTACFKFLWFDITNYSSYRVENAYENSFLMKESKTLALSSLQHVFCSLTPNAQGIFLILAREQLNQTGAQKNGLSFADLFRQCREAFLVNSDLTLQTQLTEFKDHNMIRLRKGQDGLEYLQVAVNSETLKEFVDMQE